MRGDDRNLSSRLVRLSQVKNLRVLSFLAFGGAVLLCLAASVLESGRWRWAQEITGPFSQEGSSPSTYLAPVGIKGRRHIIFSEVNDADGISDLRLWVNGKEWGPGHTPHTVIRSGNTRGFSHWNGLVYFWLPPGIANDHTLHLRVTYSAHVRPGLIFALAFVAAALLALHLAIFGVPLMVVRAARRTIPALLTGFSIIGWSAVAVSVLYGTTIAYGLLAGYPLPTAAIFDLIPATRRLVVIEPYAPIGILLLAGLGAATNWLAHFSLLERSAVRGVEIAQLRLWRRFGLLVILALMLFCLSSVGWSGLIRENDLNYFNFAGLVPNSDANAYFTATADQIQIGSWNESASRRPFSQAFRDVLAFFSRYSLASMLVLQTVLICCMLALVAKRLAAWRGVWVAMAFTALIVQIARPYLFAPLSEPLGMIWALFGILFVVEALRRRSVPHALVAVLALTIALWTRMGALLAIPLLALWASLVFPNAKAEWLRRLAMAGCAIVGVLAVNTLLAFLYGEAHTLSGGNFAYILCGLSVGGVWRTCAERYHSDLATLDATGQAAFLIAQTKLNILQHPGVMVMTLIRNASDFAVRWPRFFLTGGTESSGQTPLSVWIAALLLLPGLIFALRRRCTFAERTLWIALWIGVVASAALVFADAGWRNMHVTHAVLALFVALGFMAPGSVVVGMRERWIERPRNGLILTALAVALFVSIPTLARLTDGIAMPSSMAAHSSNDRVVAGGHWPTGFLVIGDTATRPPAMPSLRFSEFKKMMQLANLEAEAGPFLDDVAARLPVAFMTSPLIDQRNETALYVAPPEVLQRPDVQVWRLKAPHLRSNSIVQFVEQADPVPLR